MTISLKESMTALKSWWWSLQISETRWKAESNEIPGNMSRPIAIWQSTFLSIFQSVSKLQNIAKHIQKTHIAWHDNFSLLNHSCNCDSFCIGGTIKVICLFNLHPGEELTISYCKQVDLPSRREGMSSIWNIACNCRLAMSSFMKWKMANCIPTLRHLWLNLSICKKQSGTELKRISYSKRLIGVILVEAFKLYVEPKNRTKINIWDIQKESGVAGKGLL